MPDQIRINQYVSGWIPSDDSIQGRKTGLLQMNNLELDQSGALTLTGGAGTALYTYSGIPHTLYSRYINGIRYDYAANADGTVYRGGTSIITGGDSTNAAFSTAFNFVIICSGTQRFKDTGTSLSLLGVVPANVPPIVLVATSPQSPVFATCTNVVNVASFPSSFVSTASFISVTTNTNGQMVFQSYPCTSIDTTVLTGTASPGPNVGTQTPLDIFSLGGTITGSNVFNPVVFTFTVKGSGYVHSITVGASTWSYTEVSSDTLANIWGNLEAAMAAMGPLASVSNLISGIYLFIYLYPVSGSINVICSATDGNTTVLMSSVLPSTSSTFNGSIQVDILLVAGGSGGAQVTDYYTYLLSDISTLASLNQTTGYFTLQIQRQQFVRIGNNPTLGWNTVFGLRITYLGQPGQTIIFGLSSITGGAYFTGGSLCQNGVYQFAQVNVNNTGSYQALSTLGPATNPVTIDLSQALITCQLPGDPQVNEVWVFARSTGTQNDNGVTSSLNGWFRVAQLTVPADFTTPFLVEVNDENTLILDISFNINLISAAGDVTTGMTDKVFDIVGPVNGRWYYFTTNFMYPSDINDPDLVNVSLGVRICGSASELFMWARNVAPGTILVGTSCEIYMLTGTFNTLADGSIDVTYLPMGCHFPPITNDCVTYSGNVYYLASDGWRSFSYMGINPYNNFGNSSNTFGFNPVLVSPSIDRLYRGDTCYGYVPPNLTFEPGSVRFPVAMAQNKLWCFIKGCARGEVYDFLRQYWRPLVLSSLDASAAFTCQDGSIIVSFGTSLYQINNRTELAPSISFLSPVFDNGTPEQRKDCYTLKIRCLAVGSLVLSIIDETGTTHVISSNFSSSSLTYLFFNLSTIMTNGLAKTFQVFISGTVTAFVLEDISISIDTRPIQTTFLRFQGVNYGSTGRKRLYSVPFQIDTLGSNVNVTPTVDGTVKSALVVNSTRKQSFDYQFSLSGSDLAVIGIDYEWTIASPNVFEFFGWGQPKNIEELPEQRISYVIPITNFGTVAHKRVRVWPFILDPMGGTVTFTPSVDKITTAAQTFTGTGKQTFNYYFGTDVNGIDYGGAFTSPTPFEFYEMLSPEIVQILPIDKQLDKLGPYDMFKYGTIKEIEVRLAINGNGTTIPYEILFNDGGVVSNDFIVKSNIEASYFITIPKGCAGEVFTMILGPVTGFTFCRYDIRVKCAVRGRDTENQWVVLPEPPPPQAS